MIIAVDTGGTKTLIVSFDEQGELAHITKFPTPERFDDYLEAVHEALTGIADIDILSVAIPGVIKDGVLLRGGNISWRDIDIAAAFAPYFPDIPVIVDNDANLAGLAEARALQPQPRRVLYVTISTGVNGGLIINGQIDPSLATSEFGDMQLFYDGELRRYEDFASGRVIAADYKKFARDITRPADWKDIVERIGVGFVAFMPVVRPEHIVIGGSVGTYFDRYGEFLRAFIAKHLPDYYRCPITQATHPEEAVVYGCYYHAVDRLSHR